MTLPADCAAAYREERLLGQGGCGRVYLCTQLELDRLVAVKLLDASITKDSDIARRFDREARLTARLSHEHIVEVLDHGVGTGVAWIAYEYAPDGSVRDRMERGPLAPAEAVRVAEAVARALAAAHASGIVHRDVKPENVLVTPGNVYKLTDFGIARMVGKGSIATAAGMVLGTPAYLAPEVVRGGEAGPSSDLYALAVMLHEMLAGRAPFEAPGVLDVLELHLRAAPPPLPDQIGPELAALVARGLAKDPGARFASALEMADALGAIAAGTPAPRPAPRRASGRTLVVSKATRAAPAPAVGPPRAALVAAALVAIAGAYALRPAPPPIPAATATPRVPGNRADPAEIDADLERLGVKRGAQQRAVVAKREKHRDTDELPDLREDEAAATRLSVELLQFVTRTRLKVGVHAAAWLDLATLTRATVDLLYMTTTRERQAAGADKHVQRLLVALRPEGLPLEGQVAHACAELQRARSVGSKPDTFDRARMLLGRLTQIPIGTDARTDCHLGKSWYFLSVAVEKVSLSPAAQPELDRLRLAAALAQVRVGAWTTARFDELPPKMCASERIIEGLDGVLRLADLKPAAPERAEALACARFMLLAAPASARACREYDLVEFAKNVRKLEPSLPALAVRGDGAQVMEEGKRAFVALDPATLHWLRLAVRMRPDDPEAYCHLSHACYQLQRLDEAWDVMRRGLALPTKLGDLEVVHTALLNRDARWAEARDAARRALALKCGNEVAARLGLAKALLELGERDTARPHVEYLERVLPEHDDTRGLRRHLDGR